MPSDFVVYSNHRPEIDSNSTLPEQVETDLYITEGIVINSKKQYIIYLL